MPFCNKMEEFNGYIREYALTTIPQEIIKNAPRIFKDGYTAYIYTVNGSYMRFGIYTRHINKKDHQTLDEIVDININADDPDWYITLALYQSKHGIPVATKRAHIERTMSTIFDKDISLFVNDRQTIMTVNDYTGEKKYYKMDGRWVSVRYNPIAKILDSKYPCNTNINTLEEKRVVRNKNPKASEVYVIDRW